VSNIDVKDNCNQLIFDRLNTNILINRNCSLISFGQNNIEIEIKVFSSILLLGTGNNNIIFGSNSENINIGNNSSYLNFVGNNNQILLSDANRTRFESYIANLDFTAATLIGDSYTKVIFVGSDSQQVMQFFNGTTFSIVNPTA
jgi:hypothetical protein